MSNLKYQKSKDISSSRQISERNWEQVKILKNRTEERDETDESYIILMREEDHLQFKINSTTTCIDERLRKASRIRRIEEESDSNIIIKCIRSSHRWTRIN